MRLCFCNFGIDPLGTLLESECGLLRSPSTLQYQVALCCFDDVVRLCLESAVAFSTSKSRMSPDYRRVFFSEARLQSTVVSESMEHRRSQGERRRSVSCDIDNCYRVPVLYRYSRYRYLAHGQYDYGGTVQFVRYSKIVEGTQWYRYDIVPVPVR